MWSMFCFDGMKNVNKKWSITIRLYDRSNSPPTPKHQNSQSPQSHSKFPNCFSTNLKSQTTLKLFLNYSPTTLKLFTILKLL